MRVGTVLDVRPLTELRKRAYAITVDFGPGVGVKRSAAQVTELYQPTELVGRQVIGAINLPPKRMGPFTSEVLLLGADDDEKRVVLLTPERRTPNGSRVY